MVKASVACLLALIAVVAQSQLLYVANLYRHGARYPISKVDLYDYNETKANSGELSATGMRQQYNLGRYLRRDYIDTQKFLDGSFNHSALEVFSTTSLRTVVSAYCQLYGLYPDGTGPRLPEGLDPSYLVPPFNISAGVTDSQAADYGLPNGFQPIPVHDATPFLENCAGVDALVAEEVIKHGAEIAAFDISYISFYMRMQQIFKFKSEIELNVAVMLELYDVVAADRYLGRPLPPTFTEADYLNLRHMVHYIMMTAYSETTSRALSTPFFTKLIKEFDAKIASPNSVKKWSMFSGHDTNVAPTLWFLNLTTAQCIEDKYHNSTRKYLNCEDGPDFAASITFELWGGSKPTIKIQYNGKYVNLCERNSTVCDYSEWKSRIEAQYVDYNKICNNKMSTSTQTAPNDDLSSLLQSALEQLTLRQKQASRELRVEDS